MYFGRDKKNNWEVRFYYKDFTGKRKQKHRTGFKTKREAQAWANQYIMQQNHNLDMTFRSFWDLYREDMKERLRENTIRTKEYIVELKVLPYFGSKKMVEITPSDVRICASWRARPIRPSVWISTPCCCPSAMCGSSAPRTPCSCWRYSPPC